MYGFRHLFVVGNYKMLSKNPTWNKVINHCQGKSLSEKFTETYYHLICLYCLLESV